MASLSACSGDLTGARANSGDTRIIFSPDIVGAPGATVEAIVSYAAPSGVVILARSSATIPNTPSATDVALTLSANVNACVDEGEATGTGCRLTVTVPAVSLFEVATVQITPATIGTLEPGETRTLSASPVDRTGATVVARTPVWDVVNGGITVSSAGLLTAVTPGAARVRATIGGRSSEVAFTVGSPTVASITLAPVDTLLLVGATATIRSTVISGGGQTLVGRPLTYTSSNPSVASINTAGVVTGAAPGSTVITARSTEGRDGSIITATVPLRVQAPPQLLVDKPTVSLDSLVPGTSSALATVAVTTAAGQQVAGLRTATTYTQSVAPWLTATINPAVTPATLSLQANSGTLAAGLYDADVVVSSSTDAHRPVTVHVTLRVVAARRVALSPHTVDLGTYSSTTTSVPTTNVAVSSPTGVTLTGLAATVQYLSTRTGWLSTAFTLPAAAPSSILQLTPVPFGLPDGTYQARVIVSTTTFGALPDTVTVTLTVAPAGQFAGQVVGAGNTQPIGGATVTIRRASDGVVADVVTTASDGRYLSNSLPAGTYSLTFAATGYLSATYTSAVLAGNATAPQTTLPAVPLVPSTSIAGTLSGEVRDATTNFSLAGVTVELRAGANNVTGTPLLSVTTSSNGDYSFSAQPAGTYTVRATRTGYAASSVTTVIAGTSNFAPLLFISPGTGNVAWRFVLSWGNTPADLDAHLTGPIVGSTNRFHVYWNAPGSSGSSPFAALDIDQTDGLGPETITITQQFAGIYRYYVNNFSQETALSASKARVDVYQGNTLVNQFFVPAQPGLNWTVFEISGNTLTPINTISNVTPGLQAGASLSTASPHASPLFTPGGALAADDLSILFAPTVKPRKR